MKLVRVAVATCVVLLAVTAAAAQTGGIKVMVTDEQGLPLPGATVTISHETGSVKTTTEMTNQDGIVAFPVLRPGGGYGIRVAFPGFSPMRYDDVRVKLSQTLPLRVQMFEEIVEVEHVVGTTETVDIDKSEQSTRFSDEFISDLPVPGRFYQNVLTMAPGVQDADGDGNPNVHGSRNRDFQAVVGNVSNVDPLTGQWMSRINTNSIEEMEVITAGAGVEFGRAQGGFARIIQKQGSNKHEGVVEFYWRTSKLDGDGATDDTDLPDPEFDSYQPSFQISGPLVKDKLWYRASVERIDDEDPINVLDGIEIFSQTRDTYDGQVTWQVSPRNKLALQFRADPTEATNWGISSVRPSDSTQQFERDVETWTLNWTAPYSPKILVETTVAWQDVSNNFKPTTPGLINDCVPNATVPFLNQAYCNDQTRNVVSGSWFRTTDDHRQRLTLKGQATIYGGRFWGMTHQFKVGLNVENERYFRYLEERPSIVYEEVGDLGGGQDDQGQDDTGEGPRLESYGAVLSRLSVPQSDDVRATGTNWAFYGEDQFKPAQNLTITLGARVDREEVNAGGREPFDPQAELQAYTNYVNSAPPNSPDHVIASYLDDWPDFFTGYENMAAFEDQLIDILCASKPPDEVGACEVEVQSTVLSQTTSDIRKTRRAENIHLSNTNISPFLSLAWSPWANGKTAFKASVGRYYNNLPLLIPLQELEPVRTSVQYRASLANADANYDPDNPPDPLPGQTRVVGGIQPLLTILTVDRDLETPYQDEFTLKIERELWAETSMSLTYINRQFENQVQDVNVNLAAGDLGRCFKASTSIQEPVVESLGQTKGVCTGSLVACTVSNPTECGAGESCDYSYYLADPVDFCAITADCLPSPYTYAGQCAAGDPYCGTPYPDTEPGRGDGFIDPVSGSSDDNCVGEILTQKTGDPEDPCDGPFCDNIERLKRPDERTDLYLQNPFWGDIYLIGNYNSIDYEAFVLEFVRRQYRSWEMNASYTYSEAKGDGEDFFQELGDDPTLRANQFGFQSYDQTHVVKMNATTITPWGVRLGSSVSWQSGLPYSLLIQQNSYDTQPPITSTWGGNSLRPRQTYPTGVRNDQRNDSYWNIDLKATKEFNLGKNLNLQLTAEVFNLLDDGTYQVYNPFFERGVQVNGVNEARRRFGREWQVGMKLAF